MDFNAELQRLLALEPTPVGSELAELANIHTSLLAQVGRRANDMSLQIEEIYDIIKDDDESAENAKAAEKREHTLVNGVIALCDVIDAFVGFAVDIPDLSEQAVMMRQQTDRVLAGVGVRRIGEIDDPINAKLHSVSGAIYSDVTFEHIAAILQSGYEYGGKVIRKAAVIVSKGNSG
jgi:molecular chaperone GrpE (heat shock protein)